MHTFTIKDVCQALGIKNRSRVQHWVQLPPFSSRPSQARSARRFSKADLLAFAVFQLLEDEYFVKGKSLVHVSLGIHDYLSRPHPVLAEERVVVSLRQEGRVQVLETVTDVPTGFVLELSRIRDHIDMYLGVAPLQHEMPLINDTSAGRS